VQLMDLNSTNGTYVNDKQIRHAELRDGDRVSVGDVVFKFLATGNVEANYHDVVYRLMSYDGLTEVLNKRVFNERLSAEARDTTRPLSVVVFDADHFKKINDTHGHAAGDMVLRQLARTVERVLVEGAELARVGGEEFSVLSRLGSADAMALGEAIRGAVEADTFTWKDDTIPVTVSLGIAARAADAEETGQGLFQRADAALYRAKTSGRNRVCA
jgi:two-component system cell cycle response regulator